jgi:uncharacterized membrane protein
VRRFGRKAATFTTLENLIAAVTLAVGVVALGCGGTDDGMASTSGSEDGGAAVPTATMATCPPDSTLDYAGFGQAFVDDYCIICHDVAVTGTDRSGAPPGVDFDSQLKISTHASDMDAYAGAHGDVVNELMPPLAPAPTTAEREQLAEWIACGVP